MVDSANGIGDPWQPGPAPTADERSRQALDELVAALRSGDSAEVNRVARLTWIEVLRTEPGEFRSRILEADPSIRDANPVLLLLLGLSTLASPLKRAHAVRYFLQAARVARAHHTILDPIDVSMALVGDAAACRLIGPSSRARRAANVAAMSLRALDDEQLRRIGGVPFLFSQVGRSLYAAGDIDGAVTLCEEGLAMTDLADPQYGFENLALICSIRAFQGELHLAEEYLALARSESWAERDTVAYVGTHYRLAEAVLALESWDPEAAWRHLAHTEQDSRLAEDWIDIARVAAMIALFDGRASAGLVAFDRAAAARGKEATSPVARHRLAGMRALLETAQGNPGRAIAILRRDAQPGLDRAAGLARAALCLDAPAEALLHLQQEPEQPSETPRARFEALVLELAARLRIPGARTPSALVQRIGEFANSTGMRLGLALLPDLDYAGVRDALAAGGYAAIHTDRMRPLFTRTSALGALTARERTVFELLAMGLTPTRIAAELFVSINTVKTQVRNIYRKLGIGSGAEAVALATQLGLRYPERTAEAGSRA